MFEQILDALKAHPNSDLDMMRASGGGGDKPYALAGSAHTALAVRRLTPRECERLMGVGDDYTRIPWRKRLAEQCPDGPRYKAL